MASVMDQIRKLDEQRTQLLEGAKQEALDAANKAVATLRELGFNYRLVETDSAPQSPGSGGGSSRTRRSGVRDRVLEVVKNAKGGISASQVLSAMNATSDSDKTSIRNALASLKKRDKVKLENGKYTA